MPSSRTARPDRSCSRRWAASSSARRRRTRAAPTRVAPDGECFRAKRIGGAVALGLLVLVALLLSTDWVPWRDWVYGDGATAVTTANLDPKPRPHPSEPETGTGTSSEVEVSGRTAATR